MKKTLIASLFLAAAQLTQVFGGNILSTNFDEAANPIVQLPILSTAGGTAATAGFAAIGAFSSDPTSLITGLTSPAGRDALLQQFTRFGGGATVGAGGLSGLFVSDNSVPLATGDAFVTKSIYTIIGNNATLEASDHFAIVRDDNTFGADNPVFEGLADISNPTSVLLFGAADGPALTTAVGASMNSLRLQAIPEPMSAMLLLGGLALCVRRRRA